MKERHVAGLWEATRYLSPSDFGCHSFPGTSEVSGGWLWDATLRCVWLEDATRAPASGAGFALFLDVAFVCYRNSVVVVSLDAEILNAWERFRGGIGTLILILLQLGSCYVECWSLKSSQYPCRVLRYR